MISWYLFRTARPSRQTGKHLNTHSLKWITQNLSKWMKFLGGIRSIFLTTLSKNCLQIFHYHQWRTPNPSHDEEDQPDATAVENRQTPQIEESINLDDDVIKRTTDFLLKNLVGNLTFRFFVS